MNNDKRCPRCGEGQVKGWPELTEEECEVVKRLPSTEGYDATELETILRWCTRCWYQSVGEETLT